MRTLQEKYNGIQEGTFSKEHFLAEARMQQPQLITRFNGYDDAVQILKNRGMIAEVASNTPKAFKWFWGTDAKEIAKRVQALSDKELKTLADTDWEKAGGPQKIQKQFLDRELKKRGLVAEAKLTKKSLTDYRYKPTNDMDKYPYEQILRGLRVELEAAGVLGTPTPEEYSKALAKVSKNLAKDSIFYTNQVAGVNPKVDLHDKMVTATAKNTVDTFNGMKKAELKEGFKKLIKKVLSESSNDLADLFDTSDEPQGRGEYEFYSDPENYNEEEEEFELQGDEEADDIPHPRGYEEASDEEDLAESKMGDVYLLAQASDSLKDFLIKVKQEYPETDLRADIEELQHIWNSREEDQIDYDDENFSDPFIDGEDDLYEGKQSLSELLK